MRFASLTSILRLATKNLLRFWRSWIKKMKAPGRDVVLLKQFGESTNVRYQVEWYVEYIQVFNRI